MIEPQSSIQHQPIWRFIWSESTEAIQSVQCLVLHGLSCRADSLRTCSRPSLWERCWRQAPAAWCGHLQISFCDGSEALQVALAVHSHHWCCPCYAGYSSAEASVHYPTVGIDDSRFRKHGTERHLGGTWRSDQEVSSLEHGSSKRYARNADNDVCEQRD